MPSNVVMAPHRFTCGWVLPAIPLTDKLFMASLVFMPSQQAFLFCTLGNPSTTIAITRRALRLVATLPRLSNGNYTIRLACMSNRSLEQVFLTNGYIDSTSDHFRNYRHGRQAAVGCMPFGHGESCIRESLIFMDLR